MWLIWNIRENFKTNKLSSKINFTIIIPFCEIRNRLGYSTYEPKLLILYLQNLAAKSGNIFLFSKLSERITVEAPHFLLSSS